MSCITEQKREVTMYKRTLRTLLVAAALGVAIPVQAAVGMPTSDSGGPVVASKQMPLAQQAGQPTVREQLQEIGAWAAPSTSKQMPLAHQAGQPTVREQLQEIGAWAAPSTSKQMPLAHQAGQPTVREQLQEIGAWAVPSPSTTTVAASSGGGFDWNNAGIGATLFLGLVVFGAATLLTVRRHYHKPVAH